MSNMPEAFKTVTRIARKNHTCCECHRKIKKGTQYQYSSGVWDGVPAAFKQCSGCYGIMCAAAASCSEYCDETPQFTALQSWVFNYKTGRVSEKGWRDEIANYLCVELKHMNALLDAKEV